MTEAPAVVISVALDGFPPLPNQTLRGDWHKRADDFRTWRGAAFLVATNELRNHLHPEDFPLKRAVIEYVVRGVKCDPDAAIGALKPCLDGIVEAGILAGDSFRTIGRLSVRLEDGERGFRVDVLMGAA